MSDSELERHLQRAERAGIYLGAMVAVAREQHRRVLEVVLTPDEQWPGHVRFARKLIEPFEARRAKLGHLDARRKIEAAVMVRIAGAVAVDFDKEPSIFDSDPSVGEAEELLVEADWMRAEAKHHLQWLRYRTAKTLAYPKVWRSVVAIAEALMSRHALREREIREKIDYAHKSKRIGGMEHFVLINENMTLGDSDVESCPAAAPATSPTMHDGIVNAQHVQHVIDDFKSHPQLEAATTRLQQVEPHLFAVIDAEARRAAGSHSPTSTSMAVTRCGILVAEIIRRAHAAMWDDLCDGTATKQA